MDTIPWHADAGREGRRSDPTERCRPGSPSEASIDEAPYKSDFQPRRKLPPLFKRLPWQAETRRLTAIGPS